MNRLVKACFICFFCLVGVAFGVEWEWGNGEEGDLTIETENRSIIEEKPIEELEESFEDLIKSLEDTKPKTPTNVGKTTRVIDFLRVPHRFLGGVNDIAFEYNRGDSFYVAGEDGFVSRCSYPSFATETWQVSSLPIKKIASHPDGRTIALYESDGRTIHKISVWDWRGKKRVFIMRPNYFVTSISWSANGNYLFVGNTEKGIEVFDKNGKVVNIYSTPPGIILLSTTGKREKSIVTYGKGGKILYTSLASRKKLAEYQTLEDLETPRMIKNFTRIVGFKSGKIYVVNASTGEVVEEHKTSNAMFLTEADHDSPSWIERVNKKNKYVLHKDKEVSSAFVLPNAVRITCGISIMASVIAGGDDGQIYVINNDQNKITSFCPLEYKNTDIQSVASNTSSLFLLQNRNLLLQKEYNEEAVVVKENIDASSLVCSNDFVLLWTQNEKKPIYKYSIADKTQSVLYKGRTPILSCSILKGKLVVVEASGLVSLIDIESGKSIFSSSITGTQSAVQRGDIYIIIAKNSLDSSQAPLFELNLETMERTPIRLEGELAFSLTQNEELNNTFFCFLLTSSENKPTTNLIKFVIDENRALSGKFENLLSYNDEDFAPFILSYKDAIITNLGKENLIYFNLFSKKSVKMERDYALPKVASLFKNYIVSVNTDGSLTWYDKNTLKIVNYKR
ncbi:MAG: WD40 repeat domain-containing protein [Treponema sp.]